MTTKSTSFNESNASLYPPSLQWGTYLSEEEGSQIPSHLAIGIDRVEYNGKILTFKSPRIFRSYFDAVAQLFILEDKLLDIHIFASSIPELKEILKEEIIFLWETYGSNQVTEDSLTQGAIELCHNLRSHIIEG